MNTFFTKSVITSFFVCLALLSGRTFAQPSEQAAITHAMKSVFDKPSDPLAVTPVVVHGQYAVTGWLQGGKGGRAVLQKIHGKWQINVCGGDGLKSADALAQTGMSAETAKLLSQSLAKAESQLSPDVTKKLAMFDGIVHVQGGHGAHGSHDASAGQGGKHKGHTH